MKIKLPFILGDILSYPKRIKTPVRCVTFNVTDSLKAFDIRYETFQGEMRLKYFGEKNDIKTFDKTLIVNPPNKLGSTIFYLNSTYNNNNNNNIGLLKKGTINEIECCINIDFKLFWFSTKDKRTLSKNSIYSSIEDFKKRTSNFTKLKNDEKFIFTDYSLDQNKLKVVKISKYSTTHFKIEDGYCRGEIIRGSELYNSNESFLNKFLAQID